MAQTLSLKHPFLLDVKQPLGSFPTLLDQMIMIVLIGYIKDYYIEKSENNKIKLKINLKYFEGSPVIKEIKRISKPGRRVYSRANSIPKVMNGLGLAILSTPKGVMSDTEARKNNIGGEIICRVF